MNNIHTDNSNDLSIAGTSENISAVIETSLENLPIRKRELENFKIGISISNGEDTSLLGYSEVHQIDAMLEFARHLLIHGATIVYGGDLRHKGYTSMLTDLALMYRSKKDIDRYPFVNYFSFPYYLQIDENQLLNFKKSRVRVVKIEPDQNISDIDISKKEDIQVKIMIAHCLSKMRKQMNDYINARIFIGGRNFNFSGRYPGVVEECFEAIILSRPIYLIGAFGGVTQKIINSILTGSQAIDNNHSSYTSNMYSEFMEMYNQTYANDIIDIDKINNTIKNFNLDTLSRKNGLTNDENKRLFVTPHIPEMVFLVLKGLFNLSKIDSK